MCVRNSNARSTSASVVLLRGPRETSLYDCQGFLRQNDVTGCWGERQRPSGVLVSPQQGLRQLYQGGHELPLP